MKNVTIMECCRSGNKTERLCIEFQITDNQNLLMRYAVACLCARFEEIQSLYDDRVAAGGMSETDFFHWLCQAFRINYATNDYVSIVTDHDRVCLRDEETDDINTMSIYLLEADKTPLLI